ncbi:MAG: hypothetical protein ACTSVZ_10590 [Promethearchaeota archaeon]
MITSLPQTYEVKQTLKFSRQCPICRKTISFGIERHIIEEAKHFPFAHCVIHGNPLHIFMVFVDKQLKIRGAETAVSLEILRDGQTFAQLMHKWSNPFNIQRN